MQQIVQEAQLALRVVAGVAEQETVAVTRQLVLDALHHLCEVGVGDDGHDQSDGLRAGGRRRGRCAVLTPKSNSRPEVVAIMTGPMAA